ncbi:hypothetical protein FOZ61_000634 [Perkinsus olseni]|uniref:Uncharacterized protein n=1 Tax=Perkinsus olseni TaxID=32597 RepID=A0A7J6M0A4_PEROL|nr:hypothetical protein FOZ61_000634 [Perkinsus olseni]KAF4670976.1 hypothetical protein FOL46_000542 [Perkinsus olseni]
MRTLFGAIVLLVAHAILQAGPPSGSYCGSPDIPSKAFDISASWTPTGGTEKSGSEAGVPYKYDASTGDVTVTDTSKLQDLITQVGAPLKASDLAKLHYDGKDLHVVNLLDFALTPC